MTLREAIEVFDRVTPLEAGLRTIEGEEVGVPWCCAVPVSQDSANGIERIYCHVCGRTIEHLSRQWIVSTWGSKGIRLPEQVRSEVEIRRAHAVLAACLEIEVPSEFPLVCLAAAFDALSWVLKREEDDGTFERNLASIEKFAKETGFEFKPEGPVS